MEDLELLLSLQSEESLGFTIPSSSQPNHEASGFSKRAVKSDSDLSKRQYENVEPNTSIERDQALGYCSDEEFRSSKPFPSMSVFKDALRSESPPNKSLPLGLSLNKRSGPLMQEKVPPPMGGHVDLELHSGLRIKDRNIASSMLGNKLSDLRFVRLQGLKTAMIGDALKGAWATIGIIAEKGHPKVSSNGKNYAVWKLTTLDNTIVSLFLFGDAYRDHWKESAGSIIALFSASVRQDDKRGDFSLSIFNINQLMVVGTSVDFGVCNGKRKDGTPCTVAIDRRQGNFCKFHSAAACNKFRTKRAELSGGRLATGFSGQRSFIAQTTKQPIETTVETQPLKRAKHRSSSELTKLLSNADKVTTIASSQGLRFLASMTNNSENKEVTKRATKKHKKVAVPEKVRPALAEVSNGSQRSDRAEVLELDSDGQDDAMVQALSIFQNGTGVAKL